MPMRFDFRRDVLVLGTVLVACQAASAQKPEPLTDEAILAKLEAKVPMQFPDGTPLEDVLKYVKACSMGATDNGIPIYLDLDGLKKAGATKDSVISISSDDLPLKTSMRRLLDPLGLTYVVKDGLLTVTAKPEKPPAKGGKPKT